MPKGRRSRSVRRGFDAYSGDYYSARPRTDVTASMTLSWIAPLVAITPRLFSSVRPRPKSRSSPLTSVTRPPAHSTTSLPAA